MANKQNSSTSAIEIFFSYSHKDEELRDLLETHLSNLKRQKIINTWHSRRIGPGDEWEGKIDEHLNSAQVILLLVSSDFLASNYCYDIELTRALERHESKEATVIPVILRPVDWMDAPFSKLQALPKDAKPVVSWSVIDEAFLDIAIGIRKVVEKIKEKRSSEYNRLFTNLPRRSPFFVGREIELEQICNALKSSHVVQIRGLGGIGKSALAIEAAYKMKESFRDGAIWLFAPEYETIELFINKLAVVFDTTIGQMPLEDKKIFIQKVLADKKAMLILDNVEDANIAEDIINIVPHFPVLITSRPSIRVLRNSDWIILSELSLEEAVKLFTQISKHFFSDEENKLVQNICSELGNFPLAIELAAKLFRVSYSDSGLNKLVKSIKKSSLDAINLPEYVDNRNVVASFLSTYHALNDTEKQLFDVLGTLPGRTFSLEAIKTIAGDIKGEEIQSTLDKKLVALSLVNFDKGRYSLHPLLKFFARGHLKSSDPYKRMVEYFTEYAKTNLKNFSVLEMERANLLGAVDWCHEHGEYRLVIDLVEALAGKLSYFSFLSQRGYWNEAIQRLEQEIEAIQNLSGGHTGRIHLSLGLFHYYLGNHDEARKAHKLAIEEFEKEGNTSLLIVAYWQSGYIEDDEDNYDKAIGLYQKSLELASVSEDCKDYILNSRKLVGVVKYHRGDYVGARTDMEKSLDEAVARKNEADIATCQRRLAAVIRRQAVLESDEQQKQYLLERSRQLLSDCLKIENHERSIARALRQLGMIEQIAGDIDKAKTYFDRSLKLFRKIGNRKGIASVLYNLGTVLEHQGNLKNAEKQYKESLKLGRALKVRMGVALNLRQLGLIEYKYGNGQKAVQLITEAVNILETIKSPYLQETQKILVQVQSDMA